jgi:hypothetical protein
MRIIATSRPIVISTSCPVRAISGVTAMHTVSLTSLSAPRKYPPPQNVSPRPEAPQVTNLRPLFLFPLQQTIPALDQLHPLPCYPGDRGVQMATAAQAQTTPTATDPVERWLARRGACPQLDAERIGSPAPSLRATSSEAHRPPSAAPNERGTSAALAAPEASPLCASPKERREAVNRAYSLHSTGPRTQPGKQRSSLNALRHGLTARTAVLPTEDPDAYQRHIQQFLAEYAPPHPPKLDWCTKSPTPLGGSTASRSSKPSCSLKTPTPKP